jgi:putative phosphoesterase
MENEMLIGLMSDTHNNRPGVRYALDIFQSLGIEVILHAGDVISAELLEYFTEFSLFLSFGNGDDPLLISSRAKRVSDRFVCEEMLDMELAGKHIFMIHGDHRTEQEKRIDSGEYDFVFHGHTHRFRDERVGSTRVINPGALGGRFVGERSFATLDLVKNELQRYFVP